jgi:hypothetical protein
MGSFHNFWPEFEPSHPFFAPFSDSPLKIGSVFGHATEPFDVLFSGECIPALHHDGNYFSCGESTVPVPYDGSCKSSWFYGIPYINHPRALWLPLYFLVWHSYLRKPKHIFAGADRSRKQFGLSFLGANTTFGILAERRLKVAAALSRWFPVHTTNRLKAHFPADGKAQFYDVPEKLPFVSRFQFHLCFENNSCAGYLTEKLFDSLFVGSVPIYEGDPMASEWFDEKSYLDCSGLSVDEIAGKIEDARKNGIVERINEERDKLCRVSFYEMSERVSAFIHSTIAHQSQGSIQIPTDG